jgi:putative transcriptional regulator
VSCYKKRVIEVRLKQILEKQGRTRYWLAKESGINYDTLTRIENAEDSNRIELRVLDQICRALVCQPGDLLVRVPDRKPDSKRRKK